MLSGVPCFYSTTLPGWNRLFCQEVESYLGVLLKHEIKKETGESAAWRPLFGESRQGFFKIIFGMSKMKLASRSSGHVLSVLNNLEGPSSKPRTKRRDSLASRISVDCSCQFAPRRRLDLLDGVGKGGGVRCRDDGAGDVAVLAVADLGEQSTEVVFGDGEALIGDRLGDIGLDDSK